jgi:hypothetical protein
MHIVDKIIMEATEESDINEDNLKQSGDHSLISK